MVSVPGWEGFRILGGWYSDFLEVNTEIPPSPDKTHTHTHTLAHMRLWDPSAPGPERHQCNPGSEYVL